MEHGKQRLARGARPAPDDQIRPVVVRLAQEALRFAREGRRLTRAVAHIEGQRPTMDATRCVDLLDGQAIGIEKGLLTDGLRTCQ